MRKVRFVILVIVSLLVLSSGSALAQSEMVIPEISGVATDEGIEFPSEVPAGIVKLTFENKRAKGEFAPNIARLNDGVTMDDLMTAVDEDPMSAVPMVTGYGGAYLASGESWSYMTELVPGDYVLVYSRGEAFVPFSVGEGDTLDMVEPESDIQVALVDFGFGVPAFIPAGSQVWHIENVGNQWHEMMIFPVEEGTTTADLRARMEAGRSNPEPAFSWGIIGAGTQHWVTVDLEAGTYGVVCFLPDLNGDFSPHMAHGMMQVFVVE